MTDGEMLDAVLAGKCVRVKGCSEACVWRYDKCRRQWQICWRDTPWEDDRGPHWGRDEWEICDDPNLVPKRGPDLRRWLLENPGRAVLVRGMPVRWNARRSWWERASELGWVGYTPSDDQEGIPESGTWDRPC